MLAEIIGFCGTCTSSCLLTLKSAAQNAAEHALRKRNARLGDINIVLMVEHGKAPSPELIERANGIRRQWIDYWETITGHRASMTTKPR